LEKTEELKSVLPQHSFRRMLPINTENQSQLTFKLNFCEHNPQFTVRTEAIKNSMYKMN